MQTPTSDEAADFLLHVPIATLMKLGNRLDTLNPLQQMKARHLAEDLQLLLEDLGWKLRD